MRCLYIILFSFSLYAQNISLELDTNNAKRSGRTVEDVQIASQGRIPVGRYGTTEEFASPVAFLASEEASFMTGVTVPVDGGRSIR